jgi:hypothetical protein
MNDYKYFYRLRACLLTKDNALNVIIEIEYYGKRNQNQYQQSETT